MSFIASFFAINFEDWGDRLTIDYVSRYTFPIGLSISFIFVAAAFLVQDISDAWKSSVSAMRQKLASLFGGSTNTAATGIGRRKSWGEKDFHRPWTNAGPVGTSKSMAREIHSRPSGRPRTIKTSFDRGSYLRGNLGFSALHHHARELSPESDRGGLSWPRPSLDDWRNRFSGDLERGRDLGRLA